MNEQCCTCEYYQRTPADGGFICCNTDSDNAGRRREPSYGCWHYKEAKDGRNN